MNYPEDTDEYMFCDITENVPPASINAKSGQNITLPACSTEMTRYQRNAYGENGTPSLTLESQLIGAVGKMETVMSYLMQTELGI